jgi:hypothetical protein
MKCHIYETQGSTTQSGKAKTGKWFLSTVTASGIYRDKETGWNASQNPFNQISIHFESLESATAYANAHQLIYTVHPLHKKNPRRRTYSENFKPSHS